MREVTYFILGIVFLKQNVNLAKFTVKNSHIRKILVDKYKMQVFTMSGRTKVRLFFVVSRILKICSGFDC